MIYCGIDIGTTNTKAVLIDNDHRLIDSVSLPVKPDVSVPETLWYDHFCNVLDYFSSKNLFIDKKIICSITSQGGSFILLDKYCKPVSRPYSWTEKSGSAVVNDLVHSFEPKYYYHKTGLAPNKWLMGCRLKELSDQDLIPKRTRHVAMIPDFILSNLTGQFITDISSAQISGLCDFMNKCWDNDLVEWTGIAPGFFPKIISEQTIVFENIRTKWGNISFATSSHDQYAAMHAAGLENDTDIMIGTGTAWVLNARTSAPVFDDSSYMAHPGRDLFANSFGAIIAPGTLCNPIGYEFDRLLKKFNITHNKLGEIEQQFNETDIPQNVINMDSLAFSEPSKTLRRYMEGSAALVVFLLENFLPEKPQRIIMSGGAVASRFWPQVIADICQIAVKTMNFFPFTAYGAAMHAQSAYKKQKSEPIWLSEIKVRSFEPMNFLQYRDWYHEHQLPMLKDKMLRSLIKYNNLG